MAKKRIKRQVMTEAKRRRAARDRRATARDRQRAAAFEGIPEIPPPLATTRTFGPITIDGVEVSLSILTQLGPDNAVWHREKMRVVQGLKAALGVYTLLTYHALIVLLEGSGAQAKDQIRLLRGGPGDIDYWLGIGREHLTNRTAFVSEDEVMRWAEYKWQLLNPGAPLELVEQRIGEEMEATRVLFRAYQRSQIAFEAIDKALKLDDDKLAVAQLEEAYNHAGTQMSEAEVLQVAMFADVDPAMLWPQHANDFGSTFAFGRFVGRMNAGLCATLGAHQFSQAKHIAGSIEVIEVSALWLGLRDHIERHVTIKKFCLAIYIAEQTGGAIEVTPITRELWVITPLGVRHLITEVDDPWVA